MKKQMLFLLLAMSMPLFALAQTTHTFTPQYDSGCSIQGSSYLFCSDMAFYSQAGGYTYNGIDINNTPYGVDLVAQIPNLYLYPANGSVTGGDLSLEDWFTDQYATGAINPATSTYQNYVVTANFGAGSTSSFAYNSGTLTFTLTKTTVCGRYGCHPSYHAHNAVLTLIY